MLKLGGGGTKVNLNFLRNTQKLSVSNSHPMVRHRNPGHLESKFNDCPQKTNFSVQVIFQKGCVLEINYF